MSEEENKKINPRQFLNACTTSRIDTTPEGHEGHNDATNKTRALGNREFLVTKRKQNELCSFFCLKPADRSLK